MRKIFYGLFMFLLLSSSSFAINIEKLPAGISVSRALFINCLQRTQTQQLLKEYIMVGLKSNYKNPKKRLADAIGAYDARLKALNDFFLPKITDEKIKGMLNEAASIWVESKKILELPPKKDKALILKKNFKKMIKFLGKAKVLSTGSFKAVGLTGGLCRDPLYMANEYLMKVWGATDAKYMQVMKGHIAHFNSNMAKLLEYEKNTDEIKKNIAEAQKSFKFFEFMYASETTSIPTLISKKADMIFMNISKIKNLYGDMLK